ncbi:type VII secretion system ESX-1 transmembrane protein B [Amycolatopsis sulphurea]|uniref:Type VII secretion system ESX-1 transmembrane protein B n=1 Tax=Amycolatopsis sulphurea TaxID=76022 RepID=A0A2A9FDJ9_9PSEU|nr:type VII secretion protein EccB [Amycolatopsis sulphurea]PFG48642.1 type VII secretion system ESX-1 transmembrane protein B [Amycolatopsis sulphurea]
MQTQKDHVEAYSFLIGRMTSALVLGDPSHLDVPARRAWIGLLVGLLLGLLIAVGFFIYGLIAHHTGSAPAPAPNPGHAI